MTEQQEIVNAIITSAEIRIDRGAFLCIWLFLDYEGSSQGFGGHVLGGPGRDHSKEPNYAAEVLVRVMGVLGVEDWKQVAGNAIRVSRDVGNNGLVRGIGHITKDRWFFPGRVFKIWEDERKGG